MALVAVIALSVDERDADPKGTYALIFGIVAAFLVLLFFFQSRDRARDGRLKAADGAPAAAAEALKSVPNSPRWNGLKGKAGPDGIEVEHRGVGHGDWLLDLWLAERLASAV